MTATIKTHSRIPAALQSVFLASNRGKECHVAPPQSIAMKIFQQPPKRRPSRLLRLVFGGRASKQFSTTTEATKELSAEFSKELGPEKSPRTKVRKSKPTPSLSPQKYLDGILHSRGYGNATYKTLETAYYNKPSAFQQASYDCHLVSLVKTGDHAQLRDIFQAGISPNPCNAYGESLLHMICRRGDYEALRICLEAGASVQVSDDFGRTLLHDCCWAAEPCWPIVEILLGADANLMQMTDCRGALPLDYIRKEHWNDWLQWLAQNKDTYWPNKKQGSAIPEENQPVLCQQAPHTAGIKDPENALSLELTRMVVSGKISPSEAKFLQKEEETEAAEEFSLSDDDNDDDSESDEDDSDYDEDDDDDCLDEEEMADLLTLLSNKQ